VFLRLEVLVEEALVDFILDQVVFQEVQILVEELEDMGQVAALDLLVARV
jgi:hypothetical protein